MYISSSSILTGLNLSLGGTEFRNKLEKHLDDSKKGRGYISKDVEGKLGEIGGAAENFLSQSNPKLLANYSGYLSALPYDRKARFVTAVYESSKAVSAIQSARVEA